MLGRRRDSILSRCLSGNEDPNAPRKSSPSEIALVYCSALGTIASQRRYEGWGLRLKTSEIASVSKRNAMISRGRKSLWAGFGGSPPPDLQANRSLPTHGRGWRAPFPVRRP